MSHPEDTAAGTAGDEIKPYQIRVATKYLDLTKQKLELTRLPRDSAGPGSTEWWEPKPTVEPLIDFWLEQYSWRDQETKLNADVPQFRTSIPVPESETPVRVHFIHARSAHANAVPLLLIPPFPFTNLSLGHLITSLVEPDDAAVQQPFHLVIPSLPGLGFSDALPNNAPMVSTTAEMLDVLMKRLDYTHYIASNSGPSANSPSEIDWKLANHLSIHYQDSCLGAHLISPPLASPKLQESPVEWAKWQVAGSLRRPLFGYSKDDFSALQRLKATQNKNETRAFTPWQFGLTTDGAMEPNTLAYALCDSPTGLLLFILMILKILGPQKQFSNSEIITLTELTWLPGPEATMRFWAHCASHKDKEGAKPTRKPKIGITVFLGTDDTTNDGEEVELGTLPRPLMGSYSCPTWGRARYEIVSSARLTGKPGLLAWERPEAIASGARSLAKAILTVDKRMQAAEQPGAALLEQVVVGGDQSAPAEISGTTVQAASGSSLPRQTQSPAKTKEDLTAPLQDSTGHLLPAAPPVQLRVATPPQTPTAAPSEDSDAEEVESPDTVVAISPGERPTTA